MKFLADESCDSVIVRALCKEGHNVYSISETSPGIADSTVLNKTIREGRILLTEDKDFGQLVFASQIIPIGIIFLRFSSNARSSMPATIVNLVNRYGDNLFGCFVVLQPGKIRITKIPGHL